MDKYDVIARCEAIITRQIAHTSNPKVRSYLNEVADRIAEYGMDESYKIIEYSNCITLINDDYQDEVNFKLFENNRLEIGCFDSGLKFNDRQFILIEPDQEICYIAWNDHGTLRGDAEVARLEYDSHGKQVRYHINRLMQTTISDWLTLPQMSRNATGTRAKLTNIRARLMNTKDLSTA